MSESDWIDVAGFRFPRDRDFLTEAMYRDFEEAAGNAGILRRLVSFARARDHVVCLGAGSGLVPVVLAGRVGIPHLTVVEPNAPRQRFLLRVFEANGLFRVKLTGRVPPQSDTSLLVADLTAMVGGLPREQLVPSLRGALIRLTGDWQCSAETFSMVSESGLHYFPKQSQGDVVTWLRKWNS